MRTDYMQVTNTVRLDSNGNGIVALRPDVGQYWQPSFVRVSTGSQNIPYPYCAVYVSNTNSTLQSEFIDDTYRGNSDTTSIVSGTVIQFGQSINTKFTGGNPGDTAMVTVYGITSDTPPAISGYLPQVPGAHFTGRSVFNVVDTPVTLEPVASLANGQFTLPANGSVSHGPFNTSTFESWTGQYSFTSGAASNPYIHVSFQWSSDPGGFNVLHSEDWVFDYSATFAAHFGHGAMYGPYMFIQYFNYDNTVAVNVIPSVLGSGRVVNETTFRGTTGLMGSSPGMGTDDVLCWSTGSIAPGGNSGVIKTNFYNGPVTLRFGVTAASIVANTMLLHIDFYPFADFGSASAFLLPGPAVAAGTLSPEQVFTINLPKRPVTLFVGSASSLTVTYKLMMIAKGAVT